MFQPVPVSHHSGVNPTADMMTSHHGDSVITQTVRDKFSFANTLGDKNNNNGNPAVVQLRQPKSFGGGAGGGTVHPRSSSSHSRIRATNNDHLLGNNNDFAIDFQIINNEEGDMTQVNSQEWLDRRW